MPLGIMRVLVALLAEAYRGASLGGRPGRMAFRATRAIREERIPVDIGSFERVGVRVGLVALRTGNVGVSAAQILAVTGFARRRFLQERLPVQHGALECFRMGVVGSLGCED
mgnify:CR=1 FL=1